MGCPLPSLNCMQSCVATQNPGFLASVQTESCRKVTATANPVNYLLHSLAKAPQFCLLKVGNKISITLIVPKQEEKRSWTN